MAEPALDLAQARTPVEQMGGEAVAQCVWRHRLLDVHFLHVALDDEPEPLARQPLTAMVEEESRLFRFDDLPCATLFHVERHRIESPFVERRNATAAIAGAAGDLPILHVEVRHIQID